MNKPKQLFILPFLFFSCFTACSQLSGNIKSQHLDSVTKALEAIYETDQAPRAAIDTIAQKFGHNSEQMRNLWKRIHTLDSINLLKVSALLDRYGWLSEEEVSARAHDALWLVIQHSNLKTQLKYLPLLQAAVKEGKAKAKRYAYLVDRVHTSQGKFQVYGSQFQVNPSGHTFVYPIADEPNVNQRRIQMGLDSLEISARELGLNYKVPRQDNYKGKVVVMGLIADAAHKPIGGVMIYVNGKLLAATGTSGEYFVVLDKKEKAHGLQLKKEGYQPAVFTLSEDKDVFESMFILNKQ